MPTSEFKGLNQPTASQLVPIALDLASRAQTDHRRLAEAGRRLDCGWIRVRKRRSRGVASGMIHILGRLAKAFSDSISLPLVRFSFSPQAGSLARSTSQTIISSETGAEETPRGDLNVISTSAADGLTALCLVSSTHIKYGYHMTWNLYQSTYSNPSTLAFFYGTYL